MACLRARLSAGQIDPRSQYASKAGVAGVAGGSMTQACCDPVQKWVLGGRRSG